MGGIREFNYACLIVSRLLALLLNTSTQFYTAVYYFPGLLQYFVFMIIINIVLTL
jgi:hypothetical protein